MREVLEAHRDGRHYKMRLKLRMLKLLQTKSAMTSCPDSRQGGSPQHSEHEQADQLEDGCLLLLEDFCMEGTKNPHEKNNVNGIQINKIV